MFYCRIDKVFFVFSFTIIFSVVIILRNNMKSKTIQIEQGPRRTTVFYHMLAEICRVLLQILRSDWLSHRALFVIVHDEHKQDGGRAFYYKVLLVIVAILFIINHLNFFICKFLLKQIVHSLSWSLSR